MRITARPLLALSLMACAATLAAVPPAVAQTKATPEMRARAKAFGKACRSDYWRFCGGVTPGGGRVLACLDKHSAGLSPACAAVMPQAEMLKDKAAASGTLPK